MYPTRSGAIVLPGPDHARGPAPGRRRFRLALGCLVAAVVAGGALAHARAGTVPAPGAVGAPDAAPDGGADVAALFAAQAPAPARTVAPATTRVPRHGDATFAYGTDPAQVLDVAWPTIARTSPAPVLVYVHSGGWAAGSRTNVPDFLVAERARGWTVISVDYRLAPAHPYPAANHDVDRALRWVLAHADDLDIDPDHLVLAGGSAGGHLATTAAAAPGRLHDPDLPADLAAIVPRPIALVALVAPTDLRALLHAPGWGPQLTADYLACPGVDACAAEVLADASPVDHVTADAPPALFLYGSDDTLVPADPHGVAIADAWLRSGHRATVLTIDGAGHNLDHTSVDPALVDGFLDRPGAVDTR